MIDLLTLRLDAVPMERRLAQPGFWMAVALVLLVLGMQIVLSVPLGLIDVIWERLLHQPSPRLERHPLAIGAINLVAFSGAIILGLRLNRLPFREAFRIGPIRFAQVVGGAISVVGLGVLLSEVDNLFRLLLPPPKSVLRLLQDMFFSRDRLLSQLLLLVVIAPITEELFFRGIVLRGLLSRFRPAVAVLLSALLFAAIHLNPWQFLSALFLGIVFGWFYLRTGSITLCVLGHALNNGLFLLFSLVAWNIPGLTGTPDFATAVRQPWWLDLGGFGILLTGIFLFRQATPEEQALEPAPPPLPPVIAEYRNINDRLV